MAIAIESDVLRAVRVLLEAKVQSVTGRVYYSLPASPELPAVRVELENVLSNPADNRYATARIRADAFAMTDYEARAVAFEIRRAMLPPQFAVGGWFGDPESSNPVGAYLLGAEVESGPYSLPPDPAGLGVYRLLLRVPYR